MKILFVMHYPGYLRYFDSTVRLLADRGHTVYLAFDSPHKQAEGLEAIRDAHPGIVVLGNLPKRGDDWESLARALRSTVDYARYLHPTFKGADYLRGRMAKVLPSIFSFLTKIEALPEASAKLLVRGLLLLERSVPSSPAIEKFIADLDPDVVLVTPLVVHRSPQTDMLKSAQAVGVPTGLCVASWDHLTTKGMIRIQPDRVMVWNDIQRAEAGDLHDVPPKRVTVTGAQPFDRWFERQPSTTRDEFTARVGLPPGKPFVLFVGSTASISRPDAEEAFVRDWIRAVRSSPDPTIRDIGILVRPHPYNPGNWATTDLSEFGDATVWPRQGANPVNEGDRSDYFDSLYHCAAVVGINTSAMIEAAILGRPVHTILVPEFHSTQQGTLHFRYLLPENGGFLQVGRDLDEHVRQLTASITRAEEARAMIQSFVTRFVRPNGLDRACTPILADTIEQLGRQRRRRRRVPVWLKPIEAVLRPYARHLARLKARPAPAKRREKGVVVDLDQVKRKKAKLAADTNGTGSEKILPLKAKDGKVKDKATQSSRVR